METQIRGGLATPGEPGYRRAQPWNLAVPVDPGIVVPAADGADVAETMRFAAERGLRVAVQATGHGAVALDEHDLLIHTGALDTLMIDPERRIARVGAGVSSQQVLDAAAPHGLTALVGSSTTVGLAGFLSGGGVGPLVSTYGVSSDYVRSLEIVTGDGSRRRISATEEPELFWAFRGGRSLLGIITEVELELLELAGLYGGAVYFDGADAAGVLRRWSEWAPELPVHATTSVALLRLPPMPEIPPPLAGRLTVAVRFASTADADTAAAVLAPLRAAASPVLDGVGQVSAAQIAMVHSDPPNPVPALEGGGLLDELPEAAIQAILEAAGPGSDCPALLVELRRFGGVMAQSPPHADAFCHRAAPYNLAVIAVPAPDDPEAAERSVADVCTALGPWSSGLRMPNFAHRRDAAGAAAAYDPGTWERLLGLAARHDPAGLLRPLDA